MNRILLVDDYLEAAAQVRVQLGCLGYETVHAPCLAIALAWLQRDQFACILADVLLEGDKGRQLLEWLREKNRAEPIVMMCEEGDHVLLLHLLNRGAAGLLVKPFETMMLGRALSAAICPQRMTA